MYCNNITHKMQRILLCLFYYAPITVRRMFRFLANVNSCSCSLYIVVRPSVCRLSSVTFVHPTQPIEIFGSVSMPLRRSRSFKVTDFGTNRKPICDFLLVTNSNLPPILHCFRDIPLEMSKIAIFGFSSSV